MATQTPTVPVPDVREMREALGLSRERTGPLFGVSGRTIERWEARQALPTNDPLRMARIAAVQEIIDLGTSIYTPAGLQQFLRLPLAVFHGHTALQLLERGETEPVLGALASDYEGIGH